MRGTKKNTIVLEKMNEKRYLRARKQLSFILLAIASSPHEAFLIAPAVSPRVAAFDSFPLNELDC